MNENEGVCFSLEIISSQHSISILPKNIRKSQGFLCFYNIGSKWIKQTLAKLDGTYAAFNHIC